MGPVRTEYLITADLAREFLERGFEVKVECLNRSLVNALVRSKQASPTRVLRTKRTDLAVVRALVPLAMIEVKIGVRTLTAIRKDLDKIALTMGMMTARYATGMIGAVVFQIHVPGSAKRYSIDHFKAALRRIEERMEAALKTYAVSRPEFCFTMHSLHTLQDGMVEQELEMVGDEWAVRSKGHATRYYAVLLEGIEERFGNMQKALSR